MAKHIEDRIEARKLHTATMEAMQARGEWDRASEYHEEFIAPLNEWLLERGVW